MKIIDIHTHTFPDEVAAKAIPLLKKRASVEAFTDGTLACLKRSMDACGVSCSVIVPVSTKPGQVESINQWIVSIDNESFIGFGTIHPRHEGWKDELARLKDCGIKGIKFHADYQKFEMDEPILYEIYEQVREYGMIILFHMGTDLGLLPPYTSLPSKLGKIMSDFPGLKVVAAHMGGYEMWNDVERYLVGLDLYLETSFGIGFMPDERFLKIVRNHGSEKVLFGTDSPWRPQDVEVEKIRAIDLSDHEKQQILYGNAARLLELD